MTAVAPLSQRDRAWRLPPWDFFVCRASIPVRAFLLPPFLTNCILLEVGCCCCFPHHPHKQLHRRQQQPSQGAPTHAPTGYHRSPPYQRRGQPGSTTQTASALLRVAEAVITAPPPQQPGPLPAARTTPARGLTSSGSTGAAAAQQQHQPVQSRPCDAYVCCCLLPGTSLSR